MCTVINATGYLDSAHMVRESLLKKEWALTRDSFDKLLARLDPDRERAGLVYENIRRKLRRFFERRRCEIPDDYADEALDRAARKINEGVAIPDVEKYCFGIARMLILETARQRRKERLAFDELSSALRAEETANDLEFLLGCLEQSMQHLPTADRELIMAYYQGGKGENIQRRRQLVAELGIQPNALRIRVHRIRRVLQKRFNATLTQH